MSANHLTAENTPAHVGLVLDGNRRWARERGLADSDGHRAGVGIDKVREVLSWCQNLGISTVTLWMLSSDNVAKRSEEELQNLYEIESDTVRRLSYDQRYRLNHVGSKDILPEDFQKTLTDAEQRTRDIGGMTVNLAIGYGGKADILDATRKLYAEIAETGDPTITEERFAQHLSTAGQPDPDLIIRTGGQLRTSGFMMWEGGYAELQPCDVYWPDFTEEHLVQAVVSYGCRGRRFGA